MSHCTIIRDVSVDEFERLFEITIFPHHELDDGDEPDCAALEDGLSLLGAWAQFAVPLDTVTDMRTGTITFVITPLD